MLLQHLSHSPYLAPYDFFLFCTMKNNLIHSFIHSSIYQLMALQPFVGPWPLLQVRNLFPIDGTAPWTEDQPVARPLPTHRTTQTQNKHTHTYPHLEWASEDSSWHRPLGHCDRRRIISRDHILKTGRRFRMLRRRFYIICRRMAFVNASTVRNNAGIRAYLKAGTTLTVTTALHSLLPPQTS
jgi:hypothetical protein